jgi:hypothetical protein
MLVILVVTFLFLGFVFVFDFALELLRAAELVILDFDFVRLCLTTPRVPFEVIVPLWTSCV